MDAGLFGEDQDAFSKCVRDLSCAGHLERVDFTHPAKLRTG
jgi:hypothetical protein